MPNARCLAVLSLLSLCLPAQEPVPPEPTPARRAARAEPVGVTLTFPGGSLAAFVQAVRRAVPNANIVMATRAAEAMVPPMELRDAGLEQALDSACMIAEGPVDVRVKDSGGFGQAVYTILAAERKVRDSRSSGAGAQATYQKVFTLNQLTMSRGQGLGVEPLRVESILSALELVTTVDGNSPLLRFHQESGLLLVRGTVEQLDNASEALAVMANDLDTREARARRYGGASAPTSPAAPEPLQEPR